MLFRLAVLATALALSGCFTFRSTILVRPDGSGTVTETLSLLDSAQPVRADAVPLSTPEALAARAASLGATLVRTDTAGRVRTTVYAFGDVAQVRYHLPDNAPSGSAAAQQEPRYRFSFEPTTADRPAALGIRVAQAPAEAASDSVAAQDAEMGVAMARFLLGDARATVEVVVDGVPVASDADHSEGARTTLLDVSFGALFDVVAEHPALMTRANPPLDEIRRLGGIRPGLEVQPPGTVTVRFR